MSDDDSFNYKPLRVFKKEDEEREKRKRKRMSKGGSHKGKKSRSVDDDVKEEVKEGIVEMFAGIKRRQSFMDEAPTGGIFITPFNWYFILYAHFDLISLPFLLSLLLLKAFVFH